MMRRFTKPVYPEGGSLVRASHMKNHARCIEELQKNIDPKSKRVSTKRGKKFPYYITLIKGGTDESPTYKVTVGWGYVCERKPGADDAILYHEAANMWDEIDATKLREFDIEIDEAVYIRVEVDADGFVNAPDEESDAVSIVIDADEETSVHYEPKVDDTTSLGAAGFYLYKLGVLKNEDDAVKIEKWLTGSHIDHFQELPAIRSTQSAAAGIGVIPYAWNNSTKSYELRPVVKGLGQNTITTNGNEVEVRGTTKDSDVAVWVGDTLISDPILSFRDGYETTGATVIGDEDPAVEPTLKELFIPTVVAWDDPDAQIQVTNIGGGGVVYEVRGNGVTQTLTYSVNGGSSTNFAVFKDGLFVSGSNISITVDEPTWPPTGWSEITLSVCVSGVPTSKVFLVKDP